MKNSDKNHKIYTSSLNKKYKNSREKNKILVKDIKKNLIHAKKK